MRKYEKIKVEQERFKSIQCDVCKKDYSYSDDKNDFEIQEFLSFHSVGGYASVFGDCVEFSIDICQHCFKEKLGEYVQYHNLHE
jgi:hypothetical protein